MNRVSIGNLQKIIDSYLFKSRSQKRATNSLGNIIIKYKNYFQFPISIHKLSVILLKTHETRYTLSIIFPTHISRRKSKTTILLILKYLKLFLTRSTLIPIIAQYLLPSINTNWRCTS